MALEARVHLFIASRGQLDAIISKFSDLSPVQFGVPEPSTWALMIFGFCGLGFMAYRRKRSGSAAEVLSLQRDLLGSNSKPAS